MTRFTDQPQSFLAHLKELRAHVIRALIGLAVGWVIGFIFARPIFDFLTNCNFPTFFVDLEAIQACAEIQAVRPTETLETYFSIAFAAGAVLAMPWMLYQLWLFIVPGLEAHEKKYVYLFVPAATLLFLSGIAFAWAFLLPPALAFLNTFLAESLAIQWTLDNYISFITGFLFWLGVAFQMPLIFYFLARLGILNAKTLRQQWQFSLVGIAIIAAVITPSVDPLTMLLTMVPLTILYLFSIFLAGIGYRQFSQKTTIVE